MAEFEEAVSGAIAGGICEVLKTASFAGQLLSGVTAPFADPLDIAGGLRRKLCSDDPDNDPVYEPPFTGGQCNAVYLVTYSYDAGVNGTGGATVLARGPIGGIRRRVTETNATIVELFCRNVNLGQNVCASLGDAGAAWRQLAGLGSGDIPATVSIDNVEACGADDCGDLPPTYPPPAPVEYPTDVTYNIDGDTNITVPVGFVFSPFYFDIDGSLRIPVDFNVDGIDFNGTVEIAPTFNVEFFPNGLGGGGGSTDEPEGFPPPGEPGDEPIEDEERELKIIGVIVRSTVASEAPVTAINATNIPDIYAPRLGSVSFAIKTDTTSAWTPDIDVKNVNCYIPCPAPQGAVQVAVSPGRGVSMQFAAVRGRPLTD